MDFQQTQILIDTLRRLHDDVGAVKFVYDRNNWETPAAWFALRKDLEFQIVNIRTSMMYCTDCQLELRRPEKDRCPTCKVSGTMIMKKQE